MSRLPIATGAAGLAGCLTVALVDPSVPGRYPVCPFLALTGYWCPVCGSLRSLHSLLHGDVIAAVGLNVFLVLAVPVAVYGWLVWTGASLRVARLPWPRFGPRFWWSFGVVMLAFGILRNVPTMPFPLLAP